jgi:two-component system NarL family response regulator
MKEWRWMNKFSKLRVLLVDDHHLFLEGLQNLLTSEGVPVLGIAHDGFEALANARRLKPNLILMDIHMPNCGGVAATRLIKAEMPDVKIVMLTMSEDDNDLFEAVRSGASGYLLKNLDADEFFDYLQNLQEGHPPFSPGLAEKILEAFSKQSAQTEDKTDKEKSTNLPPQITCSEKLSPRQVQVLTLVAKGQTYRDVASTLNISERTVKYHMGEILNCLHLENRAEVIAYAARMGMTRSKEG